MIEAQN